MKNYKLMKQGYPAVIVLRWLLGLKLFCKNAFFDYISAETGECEGSLFSIMSVSNINLELWRTDNYEKSIDRLGWLGWT